MQYSKVALEGAILDRAHTEALFFPTKQYIQAGFQVILNGKMLRNSGTGGGHSGNASLSYKHGLKSTSADASSTDIRNIMIYPYLSELMKGTGLTTNKIQTSYFLRFPNLKSYRKDDNGKLKTEYYANNPYYSNKFSNKNFQAIFKKFIDESIIVDESDKMAIQCYMTVSESATKLADKFIGYINYSKDSSENIAEWKRIIKEKYIQGSDCESIEYAIDWYVSNNNDVIASYKKSASLGDDMAYGINDTTELSGANPAISLSPNTLINALPADIRDSVKTDIGHNYSLPLKVDYSLLFLQSFSIERTNDIKTANKGIHTHQRAYVFTIITPDKKGEYTQFPGKIQLVYTVDNAENLNAMHPGYVYEPILSRDERVELLNSNPSSGTSVSSKLIGESGNGIAAIEFPNTVFRRIGSNGIKPDFTGMDAMDNNFTPTTKAPEKTPAETPKSTKLESMLWFSGWDWKD